MSGLRSTLNDGEAFCHDLVMWDREVLVVQSLLHLHTEPAIVSLLLFGGGELGYDGVECGHGGKMSLSGPLCNLAYSAASNAAAWAARAAFSSSAFRSTISTIVSIMPSLACLWAILPFR